MSLGMLEALIRIRSLFFFDGNAAQNLKLLLICCLNSTSLSTREMIQQRRMGKKCI